MYKPSNHKLIHSKKYRDSYGNIWYRIDETFVFSEVSGWGGWFNGEGLLKIE